jgi:tripartite-type tricarboxylate transporter receptor subunit TctC
LGIARAAAWPTRTLRIVIPFPPGGTADVTARLLADKLAAALGQPVIVEARPGANGIIASDAVAKSAPDGHGFLLASASHASNASLYPRLPYDSTRDFAPVALVAPPGPMVIAVNGALPVRTLRDLLDLARQQPGAVAYGSAGMGNTLHLAGEMLCQLAGVKMLHVPYKGAAPALNDLAGGQIQMMFNSALAVAPLVKDARVRLLAQTGLKRSATLPADLPTAHEAGVPGLEVTGWFGLLAPARTAPEVLLQLNAEVNRAMALPELRDKLKLLGSDEVPTLSPEGFGSFMAAETTRYARVIKAAGIQLETPP